MCSMCPLIFSRTLENIVKSLIFRIAFLHSPRNDPKENRRKPDPLRYVTKIVEYYESLARPMSEVWRRFSTLIRHDRARVFVDILTKYPNGSFFNFACPGIRREGRRDGTKGKVKFGRITDVYVSHYAGVTLTYCGRKNSHRFLCSLCTRVMTVYTNGVTNRRGVTGRSVFFYTSSSYPLLYSGGADACSTP